MIVRLALLAAAVLATAAPRPSAGTVQLQSFQTPSGNIACMADDVDGNGRFDPPGAPRKEGPLP